MGMTRDILMASSAIVCVASAAPAEAQTKSFDIPAMTAQDAVRTLGHQADIQIIAARNVTRGKRTNAVHGDMTVDEALARLFAGTGLTAQKTGAQTYTVVATRISDEQAPSSTAERHMAAQSSAEVASAAAANVRAEQALESDSDPIVVTGTRIKGVTPASPLITVTNQDIHDAGQQNLGDVVRSLTVSYSGGQNPGVRYQTGSLANDNTGGGSSINLRGLGPDATLTLLNGHRLAYNSSSQAIDISMIPVDAVSNIQIVPDGASAIYGSDAVAGVANIILRRDFSGLTTTARIGGATSGGGFQQTYDAVSGGRWGSGGLLVAYEYGRQNAIRSDQRRYTQYMAQPSTLIDAEYHHSVVVTAHQDITSAVSLKIDGLYNHRSVSGAQNSSASLDFEYRNPSTRYAISPTVTFSLGSDWVLEANGFVAGDRTENSVNLTLKSTGLPYYSQNTNVDNDSRGAELNLEGSLIRLSGGKIRAALGAGIRRNHFDQTISTISIPYEGSIVSKYGYGEITIPIVSDLNSIRLLRKLTLSGAYRYEQYDSFGNVGTPKLGIVYSPSKDFDFKLSWGRSFKAPTLLQQFKEYQADLYTAASLGGIGLPADATVLVPYGGNPSLKPERAETWSATLDIHPRQISGLNFQITYFDIRYRNRVVQPLLPISAALSNPIFSEFVTANPSISQQQAIIDMAPRGLVNYSGSDYDPANVIAIANDLYINSARQKIHGIDFSSKYSFFALDGQASLSAQASWLSSRQQNSASSPEIILAGTQFNPPHWRGRAGASWVARRVTLSAFYNYVGPVADTSTTPATPGKAMQTVDLNAFFRPSAIGILQGLEFGMMVQNLFNVKPPYLEPANDTLIDYDSTNYSPVGRFLAFSVKKAW